MKYNLFQPQQITDQFRQQELDKPSTNPCYALQQFAFELECFRLDYFLQKKNRLLKIKQKYLYFCYSKKIG